MANWYAYDEDSVFLDEDGGEFQIDLGTAAEDVTHITRLDQRMKLVSLNGYGTNLSFTAAGNWNRKRRLPTRRAVVASPRQVSEKIAVFTYDSTAIRDAPG